jgi:hypothetical protein
VPLKGAPPRPCRGSRGRNWRWGRGEGSQHRTAHLIAVRHWGTALIYQDTLLKLDRGALNVENELRARFGGVQLEDDEGQGGRGRGPRRGVRPRGQGSAITQLYTRKCLLGPPKVSACRQSAFADRALLCGHECVRAEPGLQDWGL